MASLGLLRVIGLKRLSITVLSVMGGSTIVIDGIVALGVRGLVMMITIETTTGDAKGQNTNGRGQRVTVGMFRSIVASNAIRVGDKYFEYQLLHFYNNDLV